MDTHNDHEILPVTELATRIKVGRSTVYRWMEAGCPALRVGGVTRFKLSEVLAWMRSNDRGAA